MNAHFDMDHLVIGSGVSMGEVQGWLQNFGRPLATAFHICKNVGFMYKVSSNNLP